MKNFKYLLFFSALMLIGFGCSDDDLDGDALTDLPPGIISITPNSQVTLGNFDVKVILADGTNSPLAEATVSLSDEFGNMLGTKTASLSGTLDSIVLEGSEFNAELLGEGLYVIDLLATDISGNELTRRQEFEITSSLYAANHSEMYLAGEFNGWGADAMTLVADHTWEAEGIDFEGGEWKFKNTVDWTDEDWGDGNCDGIMEITSGGGANTACGFSGVSIVTFNDQTLAYTVRPAVEFETDLSGLYLLGTVNDFEGSDYKFTIVEDNTWVLNEILLSPGDKFRLSEYPSFMGRVWGDDDGDGILEEFSENNIVFPDNLSSAVYEVTFNESTLEISYEFVRGLFPEELYLVGGLEAIGNWTPENSIPFRKIEDGVFEIYAPLEEGVGFKFLEMQDWPGDWGIDPDNPGMIIQEGEADGMVDETGFYLINVDFNTKEVMFTVTSWGLIGDATGSWDVDMDMTFQNDFEWTISLELTEGFIKFRANDDWALNFGDNDPTDGILDFGGIGNDIPIEAAGNYTVTMKLYPEAYTYEITEN